MAASASPDFVQQPRDRHVELVRRFVRALGDLGANGVDAALPHVGKLLGLFDQPGGVGNLDFVVDRRRRADLGRRLAPPARCAAG